MLEIYQYWTILGLVFIFIELMTLRTLPLVLSGSCLFAAIIAYKYPDLYLIQFGICFVLAPLLYLAAKPYIKIKRGKNEHK